MAISSFENQCDKIQSKCPSISSRGRALPCHLMKLSITTDDSITSSSDSRSSKLNKTKSTKSPYLAGDSVQVLSRVTEKRLFAQHKKPTDIVSSFPLAANIYRANSDEFRSTKKANKKVKKSVLTLPNAPTKVPQTCTVSDTNDSKYLDNTDCDRKLRPKKRQAQNRKSRVRSKDYEFYDRDARFCSQMNINLDCSSTDIINQFTGDGSRKVGHYRRGEGPQVEQEFKAHDVWAVLRNINRFQFRPSPPMSEDSIQTLKKKKIRNKRKNNRKDTRVIETCRTEEFAYISSYDVDSKSPISFSRTSSFDRITVINKEEDFNEICETIQKRIIKPKNTKTKNPHPTVKNQNKKNKRNTGSIKAIAQRVNDAESELQNDNHHDADKTDSGCARDHQKKVNDVDNPETLIEMNYSHNKPVTNSIKLIKVPGVNIKVDRPKESSGTLHSGSSKAAVNVSRDLKQDWRSKLSPKRSSQLISGITKVVLNQGQTESLLKNTDEKQFKKPKLDSKVMNNSPSILPKLTQTEIKRRLANLKFPIVILGKDQLSSAPFQIMNIDTPHLSGLDQQVWPFMQSWCDSSTIKRESENEKQKKADEKLKRCNNLRYKNQLSDGKNNNVRKINNDTVSKPAMALVDKHSLQNILTGNKNPKRPMPPIEINKITPMQSKKPKPMNQLKDKMLKLLYKNSSAKDIDEHFQIAHQVDSTDNCSRIIEGTSQNITSKVDIGTETFMKYEMVSQGLQISNMSISPRPELKKMPNISKQPWAKAKWASDFIETVIKKIRSGVYYNQEHKQLLKTPNIAKEVSIQTVLTGKSFKANEELIKEEFVREKGEKDISELALYAATASGNLAALPGFDNSLPALEIKTLNMKEVAVKYCTTNVLVQFDVANPSVSDQLNCVHKSLSLIPFSTTEGHTKVLKCKTTIINAMLPAEICSILPKIIRSLIDSKKQPTLPPVAPCHCHSTNDCLYTISELSHSESQDIFKSILSLPSPKYSPSLLKLLNGKFSGKYNKKIEKLNKVTNLGHHIYKNANNLLVKLSARQVISCSVNPWSLYFHEVRDRHIKHNTNDIDISSQHNNTPYTALELCTKLHSNVGNCGIGKKIQSQKLNLCFKMGSYTIPFLLTFDDKRITMTLTKDNNGFEEKTSITIDNDRLNSLFNGFEKHKALENLYKNSAHNAIEYKIKPNKPGKKNNHIPTTLSHKPRKTRFVKLYKKCKSTSNISGERNSTLLSKIINLDDFFQALGSGKMLSSIFDGHNEKKIISSITEMKNWIAEINQRQAMLVLLLTNKKDTPNLIRFRPILLQGIAVNRITRASELDMEIEVIERENFNKFSEYVGTPYLTECVDNRDNLMEELYWIAKTTASDYQKPFDETSEKLLKSLLEKRKKLNPSYLRVMARYVGLGLLKAPSKN